MAETEVTSCPQEMGPFRSAIEGVRSGRTAVNGDLVAEWILDDAVRSVSEVVARLADGSGDCRGPYLLPPTRGMPILP